MTHARTHARTHAHGANYDLPPASRAGDKNTDPFLSYRVHKEISTAATAAAAAWT